MDNKVEQISVPDKVNKILAHIAPHLHEMIVELKTMNLNQFEFMLGTGNDKIKWDGGAPMKKSPTQDELAIEVTHILDEAYPTNVTTFMGLVWSQNQMVAHKIAETIAEYRKKDRAHVESQILALLMAFKQGI